MGNDVTVTKERYTVMFSFIFPEDFTEISTESYFVKDGSPSHSSRMTIGLVKGDFFLESWVMIFKATYGDPQGRLTFRKIF